MSGQRIGVIGFGEVGRTFARAMAQAGAQVLVYDARFVNQHGQVEEPPATDAGIRIVPHAELYNGSDYFLSTVTTDSAVNVALDAVPHLSASQTYVDLNSTSKAVKIRLAEIITSSGARFVEGAILGAVGASGAATRVILTGPAAQEVAGTLSGLGLNCAEFGQNFGDAAAFKMLRSVFSKGIEALLLEMLVGARRAGIQAELWDDVVSFMATHPFETVARNWIESHAVAHERRYYEMIQVVETLVELDVEPLMAQATKAVFQRSVELGLGEVFHEKPANPDEVIEQLAERLQTLGDAHRL